MEEYKVLRTIDITKDGEYYVLVTKFGKKITNKAGEFVINLLNASTPLNTILTQIMDKCSIDKIEALKLLYSLLCELEYTDYINFKRDFFSDILPKSNINIVGEGEYKALSNFIINNIKNIIYKPNINSAKKYYSLYLLRSRCFYNRETYFYDIYDGSKFNNIIAVENYDEKNKPIVISFLYSNQPSDDELFSLYEKLEQRLINDNKYKVKINVDDSKMQSRIMNFIERFGFQKEGHFLKEDGENDYTIYSKLL